MLADNIQKLASGAITPDQFEAATSPDALQEAVAAATLPGNEEPAKKSNKAVAVGVGVGVGARRRGRGWRGGGAGCGGGSTLNRRPAAAAALAPSLPVTCRRGRARRRHHRGACVVQGLCSEGWRRCVRGCQRRHGCAHDLSASATRLPRRPSGCNLCRCPASAPLLFFPQRSPFELISTAPVTERDTRLTCYCRRQPARGQRGTDKLHRLLRSALSLPPALLRLQ